MAINVKLQQLNMNVNVITLKACYYSQPLKRRDSEG